MRENITLPAIASYARSGLVRGKAEAGAARRTADAAEFRRVNWPNRAEVARSTVVVLVVVVVLAIYLGAVDVGLSKVVEVILK